VVHPDVGSWKAGGTLNFYPLTGPLSADPKQFAGSVTRTEWKNYYRSGDVKQDIISGRTPDKLLSSSTSLAIPGQPWSLWYDVSGGTIAGGTMDTGSSRIERRENEPNINGGTTSTYLHINNDAPSNGVFRGTSAGAEIRFDEPDQSGSKKTSSTVVIGGVIDGLFDPATTPMTWTAISQGSGMETKALMTRQSAMDDAARANFEKAMKIPAFDVGMANLRGNDQNLHVNMDGVKFFRFQTEANPRIWATDNVYGSYIDNPSIGTKVQLISSGDMTGLKHTFEVKQWNAGGNNNWGASVYRGAGDTGGALTRSATDAARTATGYLPAGAASTIQITELRGGAAGTINPGVNTTGLPGYNSFSGTAAGTVR
ncbi:MAG: hypothetical protein PHN75_21410, partial [Syntrophales bacterium]|nr:hypothetical protein [Syntrophales bacterium]